MMPEQSTDRERERETASHWYSLWRLPTQVEGAELHQHALPGGRQERVQTLPALVVRIDQLRRVEGAVARAAAAHERAVALCGYTDTS